MVILHSVAVQDLIVLDRSYVSILFSNKEKGSRIGGFQGTNIVALLLFLEEFIKGVVFMSWHRVDLAIDRTWGIWDKINGMIPFS